MLLEVSRYEEIRDAETGKWYARRQGLFSDRPHLLLYDRVWSQDTGVAVERYYVVDAMTADVQLHSSTAPQLHSSTTQAYTTTEYRGLVKDAGFVRLTILETMTGESRRPNEPYLVVTART